MKARLNQSCIKQKIARQKKIRTSGNRYVTLSQKKKSTAPEESNMKYFVSFVALLMLTLDGVHAGGLRRLKKEDDNNMKNNPDITEEDAVPKEEGPWEEYEDNLSLKDEYVPTIMPTIAPTDVPTQAQTAETVSDTPSQNPILAPSEGVVPTTSTPTEAPPALPALPISYETFSGKEASGKSFRIQIDFDNSPEQNAWHLFKGLGSSKKEIYAQDFGTIQVGGRHVTTFEKMETGGYTFIIADMHADGIGQGKIAIYDGEDVLLWESGGDFGFIIEKPFLIQ